MVGKNSAEKEPEDEGEKAEENAGGPEDDAPAAFHCTENPVFLDGDQEEEGLIGEGERRVNGENERTRIGIGSPMVEGAFVLLAQIVAEIFFGGMSEEEVALSAAPDQFEFVPV